jgi:molybdopterin converting factor small subunit
MPVLRIPTPWRTYTGGLADIDVVGATAGEVMQSLVDSYPALRPHLYSPRGELRLYVNLFINGENIKTRQGMNTPVDEADRLMLVPAVAGG